MACNSHTNTTTCTHTNTTPCGGHSNDSSCGAHDASGGDVCTAHSGTCSAHAGRNPAGNPTIFTDPSLNTDSPIKALHVNELKTAIAAELTRRSLSSSLPVDRDTEDLIDDAEFVQLRNALNDMQSWSYPSSVSTDMEQGDDVLHQTMQDLRDRTNLMEQTCVCECNYACTCQCNYDCTCNCNYACTCQCNYSCTCQCNYSCTCNCNYPCTCNCNYSCTCNCNYTASK